MKYENRMIEERWHMNITGEMTCYERKTCNKDDGWRMKEDMHKDMTERHDIFPEDNTVCRITICR